MDYQSGAVRPVGSFSEGWELIKNDYWTYVLMMLVFGVIYIAISLILGLITNLIAGAISGAIGVAMPQNPSDITSVSAAVVPQIIVQIVGIFTTIVIMTLAGALMVGVFKSMAKVAAGGKSDFADLFSGFEHLQSCFIFAVIMSIVQFVIGIVLLLGFAALGFSALGLAFANIVKDGQIDMTLLSGILMVATAYLAISLFIGLLLGALTSFVYPLIGNRDLPAVQALGASIKGGLGNLVGMVLLLFLGWLLLLVGAIPCGLGLVFVFPIYLAAIFAAYQRVFGRVEHQQNYNPPPPPDFGR